MERINFYFREIKMFNPFKHVCKTMSRKFHKLMRSCEFLSGEYKIIEMKQQEIKNKVESVEQAKNNSDFFEHIAISKDAKIESLIMFIRVIGVNFRNENYDEIDKMLKKLKL